MPLIPNSPEDDEAYAALERAALAYINHYHEGLTEDRRTKVTINVIVLANVNHIDIDVEVGLSEKPAAEIPWTVREHLDVERGLALSNKDAIAKLGLPRTPDGTINNCAVANGEPSSECQMCEGACPDA